MIWMKNDALKNLINAEKRTNIVSLINLSVTGDRGWGWWGEWGVASNISIWPPRVSIVQPNIPPALSENISGPGNETQAIEKINPLYKLFERQETDQSLS